MNGRSSKSFIDQGRWQTVADMKVTLIDLEKLTAAAIQQMGDESSKKIYLWTDPSERFPEGRRDDTHLSAEGAAFISNLVAEEFKSLTHPLSKHLK